MIEALFIFLRLPGSSFDVAVVMRGTTEEFMLGVIFSCTRYVIINVVFYVLVNYTFLGFRDVGV